MKHFLSIDDLRLADIQKIWKRADKISRSKKLKGKTIINIFFEDSTRTRASFEIAGKQAGADIINLEVDKSSLSKKETTEDTLYTLNAMNPDFLVIRTSDESLFDRVKGNLNCSIINAGNGKLEHPTQALLDCYVITRNTVQSEGRIITIIGDIAHSRVARSNVKLLKELGYEIRVAAPESLKSEDYSEFKNFNSLEEAIKDANFIMCLRYQYERMDSKVDAPKNFLLMEEKLKLAHPNCKILHPGPVNRDIEIESSLVDSDKSLILEQVNAGVKTRQALLEFLSA